MKRVLLRLSLVLALVGLTAGAASAQQPDRYVVVSYIKVLPGQDEAYRQYLTTTGKKVFQEQMAANANFLTWSSARAMYNGVAEGADYDYVGASVYSGPPPAPGANMEAIVQKAAGMPFAELGKKLASMRTIVGTEVLRHRASAGSPGAYAEGDFRVVNRIKIKENMASEYLDAIQGMAQPIWQLRVANGEVKAWSLWSREFPAGAATSYDVLGVTYWKDLASAIKGLDPVKGMEAFTKAHPGKSYAAYISNMRDYSQLQQRNIMQVIALVSRPTPAK